MNHSPLAVSTSLAEPESVDGGRWWGLSEKNLNGRHPKLTSPRMLTPGAKRTTPPPMESDPREASTDREQHRQSYERLEVPMDVHDIRAHGGGW